MAFTFGRGKMIGRACSFGLRHRFDRCETVVLDTIEAIFAGLPNPSILLAELRRLFRWLKDKQVTAIVTGERGQGTFTRQGLEEYRHRGVSKRRVVHLQTAWRRQ